MKKIVMVTGGSGLVGQGIKKINDDNKNPKDDVQWIYLSSKDANLK